MSQEITEDRLRRFRAKCAPAQGSECVLWTGGTNEHGYGVFWNGEKLEKAHRFALRASGVPVEADADVRHFCDTPGCVNPAHLVPGTTTENVADMWARGRAKTPRTKGEAQVGAKLSDAKVEEIRKRYATGSETQRDLARAFGVHQRTIWRVVNLTHWLGPSGAVIISHEPRA